MKKRNSKPAKRGKPVPARSPVLESTKLVFKVYSDILCRLSPLNHGQRVRVVKSLAITLGIL